jgi:tRNA1Val (adenine37-N6)-methyltransferase
MMALEPSKGETLCRVGDRINLIFDGHGLAFGTDAFLLASYLRPVRRACELGCGTGVMSLIAIAYGKAKHVTAIEIREDMADLTKRNVALNSFEENIDVVCADIRNLRENDLGGRFDAVFANPPYIAHPGMSKIDSAAQDARHENNGGIADFCAAAARLLKHGGNFYCVFRTERLPELFAAMKEVKIEPKRMTEIYPDTLSRPSAVIVEGKLGAAPRLDVTPPLILYLDEPRNTTRVRTEMFDRIHKTCAFPSEWVK